MTGRGNFFAVDQRCVEAASRHKDGLSLGVAYLVLARYAAGANHSSTKAGMTAIHAKLGLSRGRADAALKGLENAGLLTPPSKAGTRKLVPWGEYKAGALTDRQSAVLARVKRKREPILTGADPDYQIAYGLSRRGALVLTEAPAGKAKFRATDPEYLWFPNSLVDGFREGDAPLARLRQIGDPRALQMLLAAYRVTDLPEKGGIPRDMICGGFRRFEVGRWGSFTVWGFASLGTQGNWSALTDPFKQGDIEERSRHFWATWDALRDAHLVEVVSYLCESESPDAQPIHALPFRGGTEEERRVSVAAREAALRMMSSAQIERAETNLEASQVVLCPVRSHVLGVQLVGIARPVHRANTTKTGAWARAYLHGSTEHAAIFEQLAKPRDVADTSPVASTIDQ
ncbi:hypothetical protein ASF60_22480 [Methylobacterium sp. Leaf113]|uniref:hypothetical protein n=1 Tax=Methylobacterium sp. Leaf113 TaxID=1736259 RepID=UPI0006FCA7FB|nr:hypothetical protein [Methylobacterium sp. Leaf113]KQP81137.1 hypothetical protein ASF60_22480 [Methylobacterium sp. Leaf113]